MKQILQKLVSFKTTHEDCNKREFSKALQWILKRSQKYITSYKLISKNGYDNLILFKSKDPIVMLITHLDVVPAQTDFFSLKETKTKFIGRGVYDMKFAIASGLKLLQELPEKSRFALVITSDEEIGGFNGVGFLAKYLTSIGKVFVIPDGGYDLNLEIEAKGVLHVKLTFIGKKAHAATPWLGINAFENFLTGYHKLRKIFPNVNKETFKPTMNLGKIYGGLATNQVMDHLEVFLDIRFPKNLSYKKILHILKKSFPKANLEILVLGEAVRVNPNNDFLKNWIKLTKQITGREVEFSKSFGASDARFLAPFKVPLIITRPNGGNHHAENEWLERKSFIDFHNILRTYIFEYS